MTRTRMLQIAGALILVVGIVILVLWLTGVIFKKSAPGPPMINVPGTQTRYIKKHHYPGTQNLLGPGGMRSKWWIGGDHGSEEQHRLG
jgi:hypothetical protein